MLDAKQMQDLAALIQTKTKKLGFCLIVYEFENVGSMANYASNAEREDMIRGLKDFIETLEGNRDFMTPNQN